MEETAKKSEGLSGDLPGRMLKAFGSFASGFAGLALFLTFVLLSSPVYFYRFILTQFIAPLFFHQKIGKPVTSTGNIFATELLQPDHPPRCTIITNFVMEGTVSEEEIVETLETKWINNREAKEGSKLVYPEFQQYVESWMGFMFWKMDETFSLRNHLRFHEIRGRADDDDSERFVCTLVESLLNEPFPRKRSPWEVHVVRNYSNSRFQSQLKNDDRGDDGEPMTLFILRFHHALADGFSILYAVIGGLFGMTLSEISLPLPSSSPATPQQCSSNSKSLTDKVGSYLKFSWRVMEDFAFFTSLAYRPRTPWHVPDRKKKWKQVYARSEHIPIQDLKEIKNKLGASFTGVLLSCISAGVAKTLHSKPGGKRTDSLAALIPLPLEGHPKKLVNHVTATVFDLPVGPDLNPTDRLLKVEMNLRQAKTSTLPWFGVIYSKMLGSHFAPVARVLLKNRMVPMGLSNFPGPGVEIVWNGRKGLAADFVAGAVPGVAGVGFMVLSYGNFIRIAASAENAIMERADVSKLIGFVLEEINILRSVNPEITKKC